MHINDPVPTSGTAIVSVLSADNEKMHYLQMAIVAGYEAKLISPTVDRVIIICSSLDKPEITQMLSKAWTHIVVRPPLKMPHRSKTTAEEAAHYFRLQAWSLKGYKQILLLGVDVFMVSDLVPILESNCTASAFDMNNYKMNERGPFHLADFISFQPNFNDYVGLLHILFETIQKSNKQQNNGWEETRYEQTIIEKYYAGNMMTYPISYLAENSGFQETIVGSHLQHQYKLLSLGFHLGREYKPFLVNSWSTTFYIEIWKMLAANFFEKLNLPFKINNVPDGSELTLQAIVSGSNWMNKQEKVKIDDYEASNIYPTAFHSGSRFYLTILFMVLFVILLILQSTPSARNPFNLFINRLQRKVDQYIRFDENVL